MNIKQVVPFLRVASMERSLRYYVDGLGFTMTNQWVPDGNIRWCLLERDHAALMLQGFSKPPETKVGVGVSLAFQCEDALALYREFISRNLEASEPQVGNSMWVTALTDPD